MKNNNSKVQQGHIGKQNWGLSGNNFILFGIISILFLGIIIYFNSFDCSFQFDDQTSIIDNPFIRNLSQIKLLWNYSQTRFIPYFSLAINYHFGKLDVFGYHAFNLVIHILNAILVWWLIFFNFFLNKRKKSPYHKI